MTNTRRARMPLACLGCLGLLAAPVFSEEVHYTVSILPSLGQGYSYGLGIPQAINDHGISVGSAFQADDSGAHMAAVIWSIDSVFELLPYGGVSRTYGINNAGHCVGRGFVDGSGAFYWDGHTIHGLPTLGPSLARAYDISETNVIVGYAEEPHGEARAVKWIDGELILLTDMPDSLGSSATCVHELGMIVGSMETEQYGRRAVLWENDEVIILDTPDIHLPRSWARAINAQRQVAGHGYEPASLNLHACIWLENSDTGEWERTLIGPLVEGVETRANDINDAGRVVGSLGGASTAIMWHEGIQYDLNDLIPSSLGIHLRSANAINNVGQIVASGRIDSEWGTDHPSIVRAFLLTPLPPCAADLDSDGVIGFIDLIQILDQWGTAGSADINQDFLVDAGDVELLFAAWGPCPD